MDFYHTSLHLESSQERLHLTALADTQFLLDFYTNTENDTETRTAADTTVVPRNPNSTTGTSATCTIIIMIKTIYLTVFAESVIKYVTVEQIQNSWFRVSMR